MSATRCSNPPACLETCHGVSSWLFLNEASRCVFSTLSFPCLCFLLHGTRSCLLFLFDMADYGVDTKMILPLVWCLLWLQLCALTRATCSTLGQFLKGTIGLCQSKLLSGWSVLATCFLLSCVILHSSCCHCVSPAPLSWPLSLLWHQTLQKRGRADGCLSHCDCHLQFPFCFVLLPLMLCWCVCTLGYI